jgi:hypothetical protein
MIVVIMVVADSKRLVMAVAGALLSPKEIINSEEDQQAAGDHGEHIAREVLCRQTDPDHEHAKHDRKQYMAEPRDCGHGECLGSPPALTTRGENEGKPMRRQGRMKKGDAEAGKHERIQESAAHIGHYVPIKAGKNVWLIAQGLSISLYVICVVLACLSIRNVTQFELEASQKS